MSTQLATKHVLASNEPPLKRRKLAIAPSAKPFSVRHLGPQSTKPSAIHPDPIEWPSPSPSPSPPSILLQPIDIEIIRNEADTDSDNDSQISLVLSTNNTHTTAKNGYLSPTPPWGRSPSPPPSTYFHKPTKKRSRWDDKSDHALHAMHKAQTNGEYSNLVDLGVSSLIHSINMQQKKQQKVEPLLLDEHGNPLIHGHEDEDDDLHEMMEMMAEEDADNEITDSDEFYDSDIMVKSATRTRRSKAFKFIEQGTYTERANTLRAKELAHLKHSKNTPRRLDIEMVARELHDDEGLEWLDRVPLVEWWDAPLLSDKNDYHSPYKKEMITDLIENPRILRPELLRDGTANNYGTMNGGNGGNNAKNNSGIPWILTKKERKKMRRMKKKEQHQNRTDEIRLGLREAPEPRLKLSNIFRVLGAAAIRDPTAAESIARAQIWKRRVKHELHNATNMLNPQQRRDKKRRKLHEDTSKEVHVSIFVIYNVYNKLNKTKICMNAQQRNLTGSLIMLNTNTEKDGEPIKSENENENGLKLNMVIVEGGPKGIAKYQHLLLNRIKWSDDMADEDKDSDAYRKDQKHVDQQQNCKKIWEGTVAKRAFQTFHQKTIKNESDLKKFLKMHNVLSYWDMVKNSPAVTCI